jgi:hypothetical protein
VTDAGTVFVPPRPIDLEHHFGGDAGGDDSRDQSLTAFEHLVEAEQFQLVLSLGWGSRCAPGQALDLGLLRVDADKMFVVHQVNDDAGTSLILAYLSAHSLSRLFGHFLVDYLSSRGTGYAVNLPNMLPHTIWVARPDLAAHPVVAAGLLGLVAPGAHPWGEAHGGPDTFEIPRGVSLMA